MGASRRRPCRAGAFAATIAVAATVAGPAVAEEPAASRPRLAAEAAAAWLATQQLPDGGFDTAGFPGFETPDAVLALAEAAQGDGPGWDAAAARAGVEAVSRDGHDGLDALDALAGEPGLDPGVAAKLVVVVRAVGLDPWAFDPAGDGPTDLVAVVDGARNADGSYGATFNTTLYAALAQHVVGRPVPADTVAVVRAAQQAGGGWSFTGERTDTDPGLDTTAVAVQALVAAGVPTTDPTLRRALALLARSQGTDGSWSAFGSPDPNTTALVVTALVAAGFDPAQPCWRDGADAALAVRPYASPVEWLYAQQLPDGRFASPFDSFGVNTFPTAQAAQALRTGWLPVARHAGSCGSLYIPPATAYALAGADGSLAGAGASPLAGGPLGPVEPIVDAVATASGAGAWLVAADGGVFAVGDAPFLGSLGGVGLAGPIVAAERTASGRGYWLFGADGGVFAFGDAPFTGRLDATTAASGGGVVAAAALPDDRGHMLATADGRLWRVEAGVTAAAGTATPGVVALAPHPYLDGGWAVAADGTVVAYGAAGPVGSLGDVALAAPLVDAAPTRDGYGLVALGADGGVFALGSAPFLGRPAVADAVAVVL